MEGEERRKKILEILGTQTEPVSGTSLSKLLGVSRQVIVRDCAASGSQQKYSGDDPGYIFVSSGKRKILPPVLCMPEMKI